MTRLRRAGAPRAARLLATCCRSAAVTVPSWLRSCASKRASACASNCCKVSDCALPNACRSCAASRRRLGRSPSPPAPPGTAPRPARPRPRDHAVLVGVEASGTSCRRAAAPLRGSVLLASRRRHALAPAPGWRRQSCRAERDSDEQCLHAREILHLSGSCELAALSLDDLATDP